MRLCIFPLLLGLQVGQLIERGIAPPRSALGVPRGLDDQRLAVVAGLLAAGDEEGFALAQRIMASVAMTRRVVRAINRTAKNQVVKNLVTEEHHHFDGWAYTELGWHASTSALFVPFRFVAPDGHHVHTPYAMVKPTM